MSEQTDFSSFAAGDDGDGGGTSAPDDGGGAGGSGSADRPDAEAVAVAGNGEGGPRADVVDLEDRRFPDADGYVSFAVTQVDYTIEGSGDDEFPVLHVFGRTPDREREHVEVYGFDPYFYAPAENLTGADLDPAEITREDLDDDRLDHDRITGYELVDDDGEPFESIRGERLVRITGQTPRDVGQIRDRFEHYEADILFPNRLLIDKDVRSGVRVPARRLADDGGPGNATIRVPHDELEALECHAEPRINTFDIEVDDRSGFPEDGEETIVCLTSHDSYRDEYVCWLYESPEGVPGPEDLSGFEEIGDEIDVDVRAFAEEAAMLSAFVDYIVETDPGIITGWNFSDFDAPYLLDRMERLGLDIDRLSRVDEVWRSDWQGPDVKGRVVFDLLYAYKRTQFTELESYRLDAVGEAELGVGKERYSGDIGDLWESDPERLLEYNLRDVELCVELNESQEIIPFWDEVRTFVGCSLEDAPTPGDVVDMYLLHEVHGEFALPSKGQQESEDFEGGAVFEPISGVKEMVSVLDLACFSGDTDVLTPEGPKRVTDIEVGDPVYTLNPDTFECEIKPVIDTQSYDNEYGELHHIQGTTHDLKITENHRFLVSNVRGWDDHVPEHFEFAEYRDLTETDRFAFPNHGAMDGDRRRTFSLVDAVEDSAVVVYTDEDLRSFRAAVPDDVRDELDLAHGTSGTATAEGKVGKYLLPVETYREHRTVIEHHADETYLKYGRQYREIPTEFATDDWLEFLGWYVTEGSVDPPHGRFTLHQKDEDGRAVIRDLLDRMEVNYSVGERGIDVSNRVLSDWLATNCGKGYADKQLPEWVFDLDASHLDVLLETLIDGDGSRTESGLRKFWTKGDQLKDDIARLAVRCGHKPTVSKQADGTWYVSVGKQGSFNKSVSGSVEPHDGRVHCFTAADNHVVLAGRNGTYQWVGQSLYPMAMTTMNASPETKVGDDYEGETYVAPNGQQFRKEPDGVIREMIDELLAERDELKAERDDHDPGTDAYTQYDRQQAAVKKIMNSLYGVSGWEQFRLYDKENAAAITATGRRVIEFTDEAVSELNYQVTYGDTDSVMLELGDVSKEEAIETSFEIEEYVNGRYDEFAREELNAEVHRFEIEFEKLYRRFFQAGKKKRYAGHIVWSEGKEVDDIDITGFEYKRSDIAQVTKEVQHEVLERIVTGTPTEEITTYLHDVIAEFREGTLSPEEIGIPGGIGKRLDNYETDTAQVRGAKYANLLLGTNFARGSKPKRVYLRKVHPDFFERVEREMGLDPNEDPLYGEFKRDPDVICFEYADQLPEEFEIDYDEMLDKTLKGPIARVIEALDLSWEEVKTGQEQTGLESFM